MAQRVQIVLDDDIDGGEATETISFALDGTNYEIDLNASNAAKLREALATYIGHGRKVTGTRRSKRSAATGKGSAKEVRAWARANGMKVTDRGRVSQEVREAYEAAN
ncbi:Lsr2 family protein [Nocardioides sp.]|uniref:histone-like nucleoid-structuring protein Lsr2 n=1 Tax=Nocardioides sp. TaxID=35761 RepID=UPI0035693246